jgi:hypothetical protein
MSDILVTFLQAGAAVRPPRPRVIEVFRRSEVFAGFRFGARFTCS